MKLDALRSLFSVSFTNREAAFNFSMREHFDDFQSVAQSFIEWKCVDFHVKATAELRNAEDKKPVGPSAQRLRIPMLLMCYLFSLTVIKSDLLWLMQHKSLLPLSPFNGILNHNEEFFSSISSEIKEASRLLAGHNGEGLQVLVSCFGLEESLIFAPIAKDWKSYNDMGKQRFGELV